MSANSTMDFGSQIFDPAFQFAGPHLVAASAGTGKTYNIQNIYVRLVAELGFRVSEIQVMTFTEAATKELRDRVRCALVDFEALLRDETVCQSMLKDRFAGKGDAAKRVADEMERLVRLRECARANGGEELARTRVGIALIEFDQSAITTIHGFCRRALARYAFETGGRFDMELGDTSNEDLVRMARDWWRANRDSAPEEVRGKIKLDTLTKYVSALARRDKPSIADDGDAASHYMLTVADGIAKEYHDARMQRETQTFDDLLVGLRDALRDGPSRVELARHLREEFKAALVDEFQDTDPVQYAIFRCVFLDTDNGSRPPIFFVGDPKQAIYAFRGGDIFTYREAANHADVSESTFRLGRNFRSTPKLIAAVNALFRDPDDQDAYTFGDRSIDYPADLAACDDKPALKECGVDDPSPMRIVSVAHSADASQGLVQTVLSLLARPEKDVSPKDIAILVTSHTKADEIRNNLRAVGVPVVLQHSGNVFATPMALEFRTVLQAMSLDGGIRRARAALATRFFDFSPADLAHDEDNSIVAAMIEFFGQLNMVWNKAGFLVAFQKMASHERCALLRRFAERDDGERDLADLMQMLDLASAAIHGVGPAPAALVAWISERINAAEEGEKDTDEYARELESESDSLRIMTIHVSKGLEFPIVLVPLPFKDKSDDAPFARHNPENGYGLEFGVESDDVFKKERRDESMRLLYVALTRATKRTVVFAPEKPNSRLGGCMMNLLANAASRGAVRADDAGPADAPILQTTYVAPADGEQPAKYSQDGNGCGLKPEDLSEAAAPRDYSEFRLPSRGSYSSLSPSAQDGDDDGRDRDALMAVFTVRKADHPIFALSGGAKVGTCWHEIFEKLPFDADAGRVRRETDLALRVHGLANADKQRFDADVETVAAMVEKTLDFELHSPSGEAFRLRDVAAADRFSEWGFDFSSAASVVWTDSIAAILREEWAGDASKAPFLKMCEDWRRRIPRGFLKGFIDLLFRRDGVYYVVDWKSNQLDGLSTGFSASRVTEEMASHGYFFQYLLYSVVLHRLLKETLGADYSWERNFGGIRYYFLRGVAAGGEAPVFGDRPSERLLDRLASALGLEGE